MIRGQQLAIFGGSPVTKMPKIVHSIGAEELGALAGVIKSQNLSSFRGGERVREFEQAFASFVGAKYAVACSSGTAALHASVASLQLVPDDEVLVPALTFVSTASVVLQEGARVVFVDIDETYCMDPEDLERKITSRSKAIIPVHLYGQPAAMRQINDIAKKHNLIVIEDACQSHGAEIENTRTGNLGDVGCFSFYQTKNMTTGEGGMVTTSDGKIYEQLCLRREHGSPRGKQTWYSYDVLGYNYNMTEMQAAVGLVQLAKLEKMNSARVKNAERYDVELSGLPLELPIVRSGIKHARHNYPVLIPVSLKHKRQFVLEALQAEGIPCDIAYPTPLYETNLFAGYSDKSLCPNAEDKSSRLITLFTDISIDEKTIHHTRTAFEKIFNHFGI